MFRTRGAASPWLQPRRGLIWGFPKIRGTLMGVPIIGTIVFWGLYWGPLILGNYLFFSGAYARALANGGFPK